jgi:hypothetical protein
MPNKKNFIRRARRSAPESKMSKGTYDKTRQIKEEKMGMAIDASVKKAPRAIEVKKAANSVKKKKVKKAIKGYKTPEAGSGSYQG